MRALAAKMVISRFIARNKGWKQADKLPVLRTPARSHGEAVFAGAAGLQIPASAYMTTGALVRNPQYFSAF
jgi:hypothetical protein